MQVAGAPNSPCRDFAPSQGRKEQRSDNAENGNNDEQFEQCERGDSRSAGLQPAYAAGSS
jgi:hypothetical protein